MKSIVGFGALNLDLIFEVGDLKAISLNKVRWKPGEEFFGSDEEFIALLERLNRFGTLKSKSGGGSAANTTAKVMPLLRNHGDVIKIFNFH
jgi:hypothetical protein